jgi:hypothetical protein
VPRCPSGCATCVSWPPGPRRGRGRRDVARGRPGYWPGSAVASWSSAAGYSRWLGAGLLTCTVIRAGIQHGPPPTKATRTGRPLTTPLPLRWKACPRGPLWSDRHPAPLPGRSDHAAGVRRPAHRVTPRSRLAAPDSRATSVRSPRCAATRTMPGRRPVIQATWLTSFYDSSAACWQPLSSRGTPGPVLPDDQATQTRSRAPQDAPPPPHSGDPRKAESSELEAYVCGRLARQLRMVGDGLAWRSLGEPGRHLGLAEASAGAGVELGRRVRNAAEVRPAVMPNAATRSMALRKVATASVRSR